MRLKPSFSGQEAVLAGAYTVLLLMLLVYL